MKNLFVAHADGLHYLASQLLFDLDALLLFYFPDHHSSRIYEIIFCVELLDYSAYHVLLDLFGFLFCKYFADKVWALLRTLYKERDIGLRNRKLPSNIQQPLMLHEHCVHNSYLIVRS